MNRTTDCLDMLRTLVRSVWLFLGVGFVAMMPLRGSTLAHAQPFSGTGPMEVDPLYEPEPQPVEDRRWADVEMSQVFSVSKSDRFFLYGARHVERDSIGRFYVLDREDRRVKTFDSEGNFLGAIGDGRGPGPAEFQWPMDFAVTPGGDVWIIDSHRRKLARFGSDGSLLKSFQLQGASAPRSITLTEAGNAIVLSYGLKPLFRKWSPDGALLQEFGTLVRNQSVAFTALEGLVRSGRSGFVFAPLRASHLLRFGADTTLAYAVETMDEVGYPTVTRSAGERPTISIDPVRRFSTLSVDVHDGKIYYYSYPATPSSGRVLDVFRYADGRYLYSIELPVGFREFDVDDHVFAGIRGSRLTVWRWSIGTTGPGQ